MVAVGDTLTDRGEPIGPSLMSTASYASDVAYRVYGIDQVFVVNETGADAASVKQANAVMILIVVESMLIRQRQHPRSNLPGVSV